MERKSVVSAVNDTQCLVSKKRRDHMLYQQKQETNCFTKSTGKSGKLKCANFLPKKIEKLRFGEKSVSQ